jgi:hypothetical protein
MLVACRLAGLSALERHYAGVRELPQQSRCGKGGHRVASDLTGTRCWRIGARRSRRILSGHPRSQTRERLDRGRCGCYMPERIQRGLYAPPTSLDRQRW